MRRRGTKLFFGWWTVLTSGFLCLWGYGFQAYGFSALFKPISSELGFGRAVTSVAAGIGRFEGGFEAPISGWVTDKFGPRWIVLLGILLFSTGLVLMYGINSLWAFYIVWGIIIGTGANIGLSVPLDTAITNWFVKKRGIALSIKWVLSGLSGVLILPLVAWLITIYDWRITCVIGGLVMGIVGLPLVWFFMKQRRPEYYGLLPDGATTEEAADTKQTIDRGIEYATEVNEIEFTIRQAMRTRAFWILIVAHIAFSLVEPGFYIHGIPFLTDIGFDPVRAAGMLAIYVGASIPARFIAGFITDRVTRGHLRFLYMGAFLLEATGFSVFLLYQTTAMIYLWYILVGFATGINFMLTYLIRARYFGRKAFGSIHGTMMMIITPAGVIAPIYAGWVYDTTSSYLTAFTLYTALLIFAAIILPFAKPPKPPAHITDIHQIA